VLGQHPGLEVYYIKAPGFGTCNSTTSFAEFFFPKMSDAWLMTVFVQTKKLKAKGVCPACRTGAT